MSTYYEEITAGIDNSGHALDAWAAAEEEKERAARAAAADKEEGDIEAAVSAQPYSAGNVYEPSDASFWTLEDDRGAAYDRNAPETDEAPATVSEEADRDWIIEDAFGPLDFCTDAVCITNDPAFAIAHVLTDARGHGYTFVDKIGNHQGMVDHYIRAAYDARDDADYKITGILDALPMRDAANVYAVTAAKITRDGFEPVVLAAGDRKQVLDYYERETGDNPAAYLIKHGYSTVLISLVGPNIVSLGGAVRGVGEAREGACAGGACGECDDFDLFHPYELDAPGAPAD